MRRKRKAPLLLSLRIILINLAVLTVGFATAVSIPALYKAQIFADQLKQSESSHLKNDPKIIQHFDDLSTEVAVLTVAWSLICVGVLSIWMILSISVPLQVMQDATKRFIAGETEARIPPLKMPELHQLGLILNSVLSRTQAMRGQRELISEFAHEMSTPLTSISGYLELMIDGTIPLTPEALKQVMGESDRLIRLLNEMRRIIKTELEDISLHFQVVHPEILIAETVAFLRTQAQQCSLVFDCPTALPPIFADPDRVKQILLNLIKNAVQYTSSGTVTVRAWRSEEFLWISVTDTGVGISPESLPRIFDRRWRSTHSQHLHQDGMGIGLAVAKWLVEIHGGQIDVESVVNEGSSFRFSLPLAVLPNATLPYE